jgi:hypothetical protein
MEDNTILLGKKIMHSGAMMGIVKNGGQFQVGNIIIEVVAQSGDFRHVQIYQQGCGATPVKQSYVRTKKVQAPKPEPKAKPEKKRMTTTVTDEVMTL